MTDPVSSVSSFHFWNPLQLWSDSDLFHGIHVFEIELFFKQKKNPLPFGFQNIQVGGTLLSCFFSPGPRPFLKGLPKSSFQNTAILRFEIYYSCPMLTQQPFIADDLPTRELLSLKKACMVFYDASGALAWQDLEVLNPFKKTPRFFCRVVKLICDVVVWNALSWQAAKIQTRCDVVELKFEIMENYILVFFSKQKQHFKETWWCWFLGGWDAPVILKKAAVFCWDFGGEIPSLHLKGFWKLKIQHSRMNRRDHVIAVEFFQPITHFSCKP